MDLSTQGPLALRSAQKRRSVTLLNGKAAIKVPVVGALREGVQRPGVPPSPLPAHRVGRPEWGCRLALPVSPSRHTVGTSAPPTEVKPLLQARSAASPEPGAPGAR